MSEEFDPYRKWLGIPPKDQPPNHYRLLGIPHFEDDPDVIENAATRQMAHVRTFQGGRFSAHSQRILNELTSAKLCLLQPAKKAPYDAQLRQRLQAAGKLSSESALEPVLEDEAGMPPPPPAGFRQGEGRWRTGGDTQIPPPAGVRPVPIPMPSAPVVATPALRRTTTVARGRKQSSPLPMLLLVGALCLLVIGGGVIALMYSQDSTTAKNHPKPKPSANERPTPKPQAGHTKFPLGSTVSRPKPPFQPKTDTVASRPSDSTSPLPQTTSDPKAELILARQAMSLRDESKYQFHINQANYLNTNQPGENPAEIQAEEEHLRELHKQLASFWQSVRDGAEKKIPKGERFKFRKHEVELVSLEGDNLIYKLDGKEESSALKKLPGRIAVTIAYRAFGNDNIEGKIAMALFLAVDAEAASDPGSYRLAGKLAEDLANAGVENNPLLKRELLSLPKSAGGDDDFTPPMIVGGATPTSGPLPGANPPPVSDRQAQKEAREKFQAKYRERLLQAEEQPANVKPLMDELAEGAKTAESNELKVVMLTQACELAAKLGDSASIVQWSEEIGPISGENPLDIQYRLFGRCKHDSPELTREFVKNCLAAIGKANEQSNLYLAIEFLKMGIRAGEKFPTVVEFPKLVVMLQELEKAKAERK
ncbi:hypothetical protein ETAA8_53240 [Anatilimnocola aggregata]|uniref:Uncharacterized protein n=1 Tax=Anatilimnocola aggregata TaxID=2528021 RepID=A0A517YJ17_9BACT|nr:hypothetical protein [Anatilimnocola aggregata]QDU30205.1 hypothetical protein ETAA8_53240 [Anatilimnocola aggregata]